ncbi:MAG: enoyl-CoA hydratase/isomerase family protein [Thermodesulfovibrionales bacterium]|nr:enoyl-CoA hydratase/isomerase family protein [Thermodesulfovibrionales bacterium]
MSDSGPVSFEIKDGIAIITLNRPDAMNAINMSVLDGLSAALDSAGTNAKVRGIIITGAGEKAFSAGADISVFHKASPEEIKALSRRAVAVFGKASSIGTPTVAAINGYALGGGLELAESCMLRVAVEGARLGHPEVRIGAVAAWGGTTRLPRLVGLGRAAEMLLTGGTVTAEEALRMGLVNRVATGGKLMEESEALLREVMECSPLAVSYTWEAMRRGMDVTLEQALETGVDFFGLAAGTDDFREGTGAFLKKRKPSYKGR